MQYKELRRASTNTDGRGGLNLKIIGNYPIILPPMELQNEFAAFVKQIDKSKLSIQQSLEKLETLKKSLMQQYFG
jgi:type I restriction enzyme S subunit